MNFIHEFVLLEQKSSLWTPHQTYKEALNVVSSLGVDETNFFKLSLGIHEAAPRIEAYNQFYRESVAPSISEYNNACDVWAQIEDQQYCDLTQFIDALQQLGQSVNSIQVLPFDHIIPGNEPNPIVALYTDRFSSEFATFHDALKKLDIGHVIRYRPPVANVHELLYLSGYGVEMALKKTDYLVIDDRSSQSKTIY